MDLLATVARRPGRTLAAAIVIAALALPAARGIHLDADLVSLLPSGSRAADAMGVFLERFGGLERVYVLVSAPGPDDPGAMADVLEDLTEKLAAAPEVASARCGIRPADQRFVLRAASRAPLLAGAGWRDRLENAVRSVDDVGRILRAELLSPTGTLTSDLRRVDPLGLSRGLAALRPGADLPLDPMSLTFQTDDAAAGLILVTPAAGELDAAAGRALAARLDELAAELADRAPGWTLDALGGPLYAAHDERVLRSDLQVTAMGSVMACLVVLVAAFGGWRAPLAIFTGLTVGLAVTAAVVALSGPVTAVAVGLAAVLVGLGLDYGIHLVARYRDDEASDLAAALTAPAAGIVASAATTAAGFGVLGLAHFRPLRETGGLIAIGIVLVMLATFAATGPAVALLGGRRTPTTGWRWLAALVRGVASWAARSRGAVWAVVLLVTGTAIVGLGRLALDPDPGSLRPTDHPTRRAERRLGATFGIGTDTATVIVKADDLGTALEDAEAITTILAARLGQQAHIQSPSDWLAPPARTAARLDEISRLGLEGVASRCERSLRSAGLDPAAFRAGLDAIDALATGRDPAPPDPADWPDWLGELVRIDADGAWAAVRVRLQAGVWPNGPPDDVIDEITRASAGAVVVSAPRLGVDLRRIAASDVRRLAGVALALMVAVVGVSFRGRPRPTLVSLVPVLLGTTWTLGLWGLLGRPVGLLDLAAMPILLGLGLDDGVHAVHGARSHGSSLAAAIAWVGPPIALTSLTTCVGFASLGLSHVPALRSLGLLVALGVTACLVATLVVLPTFDHRGRS